MTDKFALRSRFTSVLRTGRDICKQLREDDVNLRKLRAGFWRVQVGGFNKSRFRV